MELTGGCLCGATRYACAAEPIASYLCHCTDCQKLTGGPYSTCTLVPGEALRLTRGSTREFVRPGGSGTPVTREFCPECGSQLFSSSSANPDWKVVRSGTLDDTSRSAPKLHIWTRSALAWALPDDGATRLPQGPGHDAP